MSDSRETTLENSRKVIGVRRLKEPMPMPEKTRVFTVANQKGGVGKTTSAVNVAAALAMGGLKVLVIDLDPQGNACTALGVDRNKLPGMYEVLVDNVDLSQTIQKVVGFPNLECAPANRELAGAEIALVTYIARESILKGALVKYLDKRDQQGDRLDYVIIDCPPSLGLLTVNALTAAAEVLVPIQCEYYSLEGISLLMETLGKIQKSLNPLIRVSTILLTMFDSRTRLANDVADDVRRHFPNELIDIPIPRAVRISEAPSFNQTVMTYDASSQGAIAYMGVAREIARRGVSA
jgi:chromosome partitioning protein